MAESSRINILCIEDDLAVTNYISTLLDKERYSITSLTDGQKALDFLLTTTIPPDIILLDYILPSLDGLKILHALKVNKKEYTVVFLTADSTLDTAVTAMKEGAVDYLTKSANLKTELNIKIEKAYQLQLELKKTEQALKKVTEEMNHFFTVALDLLCIIDNVTYKFKRLNKAWEDTLGYSIDELINKSFMDFVHPEDIESTRTACLELDKSGRLLNFVNRYRCKDGSYKFIEWSSITNSDGTYYSSAHDITKRKINEMAVKESELRFRSIFETANAGIFFCDKNGQFILVNKVLQNMLGYSLKELYHMNFSQLTHSDDFNLENEKIAGLIINEFNQFRIEKRYVSKADKIIWVDMAVAVMREEANDSFYYVGVVNDISEQKQYEDELKKRDLIKDKFFSIIAHDLRSQFSVIRGFSELLTTNNKFDELERQKIVNLLNVSSQNGLALLEDLLEWSRSQLNKLEFVPEKLNLHTLIDDVFSVIKNQAIFKQIEITSNISSDHEVVVDKRMMDIALRNLLENAIKFTPKGGQVTVSATIKENENIISVKDNGVGMPPDIIEKLFQIDIKHSTQGTEKEKGTGLGLILVGEFIEKHGGNISVKSEIDHGSEFIISIPKSLSVMKKISE
jgi:PAS domain S-box-containing protein